MGMVEPRLIAPPVQQDAKELVHPHLAAPRPLPSRSSSSLGHTFGNIPSALPSQPWSFPQSGLAEGYLQRKTWPASPTKKNPEFLHKSTPRNPNFDALTHAYGVFSFKTNPTSFTCPALSWGSEQRNLCFSPISNSNSLCDCSSIPIRNITKPDCTSWEWFVQELGLVMTLPY